MEGELTAWLQKRCHTLTGVMCEYIMAGGDLNDPQYRQQLGQHQAYMNVRSFISGARKAREDDSHAP